MKSRLLTALVFSMIPVGGILVVASPASAADPTPVFVTVCGDSTDWFVNGDEWDSTDGDGQGDRRPLATSDGLVFAPSDLIHHLLSPAIDLSTTVVTAGDYVGTPAPDLPDFFSMEVVNDDGSGYATLRWDETASLWEVTTGGSTSTGTDPAALLTSLGKSTIARTFGVGYTNNPPGTVTSLVSSINFMGQSFDLTCPPPAPSPSPSPVPSPSPSPVVVHDPGKTVIVTKTIPVKDIVPAPTTSAPASALDLPETPTPEETTSFEPVPSDQPSLAAGTSNTGDSLAVAAIVVAGLAGLFLAALGITGILRNRRRSNYQGAHSTDTQPIPTVVASKDEHSISDYHPGAGGYDPALGGVPGSNYPTPTMDETAKTPVVDDTQPLPPVE